MILHAHKERTDALSVASCLNQFVSLNEHREFINQAVDERFPQRYLLNLSELTLKISLRQLSANSSL
ncbi:hypothetical protein EMCRGX_G019695 [Ephydatia muelleri]